jgi:hypothetical protein
LNERNGEVVCPSTVKNIVNGKISFVKYFLARIAGSTPFIKSTINVNIPNKNPAVRITFVVPGFFDPTVRISIPLKILVNMYAVGIEPMIYENFSSVSYIIY